MDSQIIDKFSHILQIQSVDGEWNLPTEKLIEILSLRKEDYFRKTYNLKTEYPRPSSFQYISNEDIPFLNDFFIQYYHYDDLEEDLFKAGVYIPISKLIEFRNNFKLYLTDILLGQKLDKDLLLLLASSTKNYDDAVESYISSKLDLDYQFYDYAGKFMKKYKIPTEYGSEVFLKKYLSNNFSFQSGDWKEVVTEFSERSYYELFHKFRERKKKKKKPIIHPQMKELVEYFGLDIPFTIEDLKKSYTNLLKKYHPDINKNGLEKTKEIIEKYNKLKEWIE
jgi:hypothetical protein